MNINFRRSVWLSRSGARQGRRRRRRQGGPAPIRGVRADPRMIMFMLFFVLLIPMHVDRATFDDVIVGFSLGAAAVMDLEPVDARRLAECPRRSVLLEGGSAYVLSGEARWRWRHGIEAGPHWSPQDGSPLPPGRRVSVTLRRLRWRRAEAPGHREPAPRLERQVGRPPAQVFRAKRMPPAADGAAAR
ncbi:unnamed protein product [Prorocentrum cordatum]|uniref:Alpha-ketoglutarate-dependent dioxygenase AlkB-like domain-containing protein n=1 Tax=Prorocentrum cordatum TaxID=2364126 RepID=A0ABN9VYH2_9DINO|nr:unnamed protein product [Polarella glacialis]